ncbi:MAG: hypothetical protein KBB54_04575 [Candidatus Pacebacteria bacterium]|nr:hypothetical protein [Candidatus Paceibacterota bacterium]MBP6994486.1 hypothetical protein [Candidatus Woesebacteria bacterium]
MTKPVLAVDFDDVVAGFNQAFIRYHNAYFGTTVQYEDIVSYDMALTYGTNTETIGARVVDFYHNHHDLIEPLYDAIENLEVLRQRYRLEVVTNRCESLAPITLGWKMRHIPKIFSGAHYANGFESKFPERKRSKLEICEEIGAVAFVDDAINHANLVATGLGINVFLPNRPWNQTEEVCLGVTRVDSWKEITKQLML